MTELKVPEVPFRKLDTQVFGSVSVDSFWGKRPEHFSKHIIEYQYFDKEKGWAPFPTEYEYKEIESK